MTSFAADVKNELAHLTYQRPCCRRAEMAGLLRLGAAMTLGPLGALGLSFATENAAVARKVLTFLKEEGIEETEVAVRRYRRLKKNNSYLIGVRPAPKVAPLLAALGLTPDAMTKAAHGGALLRRSCCRIAYLRGAFLGGGSINRPAAACHLEFVTGHYQIADLLESLLKKMGLPVGITERKDAYVIYLKEGDAIADFLALMEADEAVKAFEVARNVKEVRNQVNRLVNCETANINKTAAAAAQRIAEIRRLKDAGKLDLLAPPLQETALARLKNPAATLSELAALLGIGRSGVNHRLRRIAAFAKQEEEH